jgi:hypothetical protein
VKIERVKLVPVHRYSYRRPNMENDSIITGVYNCIPDGLSMRLCFQITYPDGFVDYVPISEITNGNYMVISEDKI